MVCSKTWLNWNSFESLVSCSDESVDKAQCGVISNCQQSVCYTDIIGKVPTTTSGCKMCSKGYGPSGHWVNGGYIKCLKDSSWSITNCDTYYHLTSSVTCYACTTNYAVSTTGTSCSSYTRDSNCRV